MLGRRLPLPRPFLPSLELPSSLSNPKFTSGNAMLQSNLTRPTADQEALAPAASSLAELVETVLRLLRRQYAVILFVTLLTVGSAAVYVFTTPRSFTAQASLIIDTRKVQVFQQPPILSDMNFDFMAMESQLQLLKSDNVALAVIKNLRLTEDPEFVGSDGGVKMNCPGFFLTSAGPPSESELTEAVLGAFQKRLTVTRVGGSSVIEIKFQSTDPGARGPDRKCGRRRIYCGPT